MSTEKVQEFLKMKEDEKKKKDAKYKYKVLSHFELGEHVYYKEGDNAEDYPITEGNYRFKYDCDISDEDFEKVCKLYEQEINKSETEEIKDGAEKTLNACSIIVLIIGIITFIALWINSIEEHYELYTKVSTFNWSTFGTGAGILLVSIINLAFSRVIINISHKLNKLK